jgi:hypothetical protein
MQTRRLLAGWLAVFAVMVLTQQAQAGWHRRHALYAQYQRATAAHAPATNRGPAQAQEKPQQFRQLAIGTEFYYLADRDRRLFPYKKLSPTHAQLLPSGTRTNAPLVAVPGEAMVILKQATPAGDGTDPKPAAKKDGQRNKPAK